jgi:hypothetical protein
MEPFLIVILSLWLIMLLSDNNMRLVYGWMNTVPPSPFMSRATRKPILLQQQQRSRRRSWENGDYSSCGSLLLLAMSQQIDYQSDYGRGQDHLSAFLEEGDVVVYQTGIWYVDGVQVGNDDENDGEEQPSFKWAKIDTMQVVWTHNCEHGVLRGIALYEAKDNEDDDDNVGKVDDTTGRILRLAESDPLEFVEFGPEQLVARIPVEWDDKDQHQVQDSGVTSVPVVHWGSKS